MVATEHYVEIFRRVPEGPKKIGEVVMRKGNVDLSRVPSPMRTELQMGIHGRPERGLLKPEDGMLYMKELFWAFSGSYMTASKVNQREET